MKFSEAIAKLEENQDLEFEATSGESGKYLILRCDINGYFKIFIYFGKGEDLISQGSSGGAFNGNIHKNINWQQILKPVDFMTAFKSWQEGKAVYLDTNYGRKMFKKGVKDSEFDMRYVESGRWYVV